MAAQLYEIQYALEAVDDIAALRAFDQRKILDGVERHLRHQPTHTSRSRIKKMKQPFWSQLRLRVDDFRVYYDVDESLRMVNILRVLKKGQEETQAGRRNEND